MPTHTEHHDPDDPGPVSTPRRGPRDLVPFEAGPLDRTDVRIITRLATLLDTRLHRPVPSASTPTRETLDAETLTRLCVPLRRLSVAASARRADRGSVALLALNALRDQVNAYTRWVSPPPSRANEYAHALLALRRAFPGRVAFTPSTVLFRVPAFNMAANIPLGPYTFTLHVPALSPTMADPSSALTAALGPSGVPSAANHIHPHINGFNNHTPSEGHICLGDGCRLMLQCLLVGDLYSFFGALDSWCHTYNPLGPYRHLINWFHTRNTTEIHRTNESLFADAGHPWSSFHAPPTSVTRTFDDDDFAYEATTLPPPLSDHLFLLTLEPTPPLPTLLCTGARRYGCDLLRFEEPQPTILYALASLCHVLPSPSLPSLRPWAHPVLAVRHWRPPADADHPLETPPRPVPVPVRFSRITAARDLSNATRSPLGGGSHLVAEPFDLLFMPNPLDTFDSDNQQRIPRGFFFSDPPPVDPAQDIPF